MPLANRIHMCILMCVCTEHRETVILFSCYKHIQYINYSLSMTLFKLRPQADFTCEAEGVWYLPFFPNIYRNKKSNPPFFPTLDEILKLENFKTIFPYSGIKQLH